MLDGLRKNNLGDLFVSQLTSGFNAISKSSINIRIPYLDTFIDVREDMYTKLSGFKNYFISKFDLPSTLKEVGLDYFCEVFAKLYN
jgi:hypothetical protein